MGRTTARILDEYLVASAKAGDRRAFAQLGRRWQRRLVTHAWRLTGNIESARNAVQAAWVEIVRGLDRLQDERAFPAWAYRIVSRSCARQIGRAQRRRELTKMLAREPVAQEVEGSGTIDANRLRAAIHALPREQRAAIALYSLEELSVAEVAVALNVPVGTVKTRLLHARRKLRAALEGEL